jgi:predicted HTH transcriptional regulator
MALEQLDSLTPAEKERYLEVCKNWSNKGRSHFRTPGKHNASCRDIELTKEAYRLIVEGKARTSKEVAAIIGCTSRTAQGHLAKLADQEKLQRWRYGPNTAWIYESINNQKHD